MLLRPDGLSPGRLRAAVTELLDHPIARPVALDLGGLATVDAETTALRAL